MPDPKRDIKAAVEAVRKLREAAGKTAEEIEEERKREEEEKASLGTKG